MLTDLFKKMDARYQRLLETNPVNNIVGLSRSFLALGTFLTLVSNGPDVLFPATQLTMVSVSSLVDFSLFHALSSHIVAAQLISILILFLVIIGIYPRYTGILHWYVSFSFFTGCAVIDGGDQVNSVLSFFLVPLTLLDGRKWHWQQEAETKGNSGILRNSISWAFVWLIQIQMSVIYLHAAVAKLKVFEWVNGTATYYWFTHHYHGASSLIKPFVVAVTSNPILVVLLTWGTVLLEFLLFSGIFLRPDSARRRLLLIAGIGFHFGIVLIHGLISFYFTMVAGLILYLSNHKEVYEFKPLKHALKWKTSL